MKRDIESAIALLQSNGYAVISPEQIVEYQAFCATMRKVSAEVQEDLRAMGSLASRPYGKYNSDITA